VAEVLAYPSIYGKADDTLVDALRARAAGMGRPFTGGLWEAVVWVREDFPDINLGGPPVRPPEKVRR
jgi:hypothetical protein